MKEATWIFKKIKELLKGKEESLFIDRRPWLSSRDSRIPAPVHENRSLESWKVLLVTKLREKNSNMATTTSGYLEQYLDSLENLPSELKRNFYRMHDLDTKNKDILVEIDTSSDDYLRKVRDLSPSKRKAEMEKIQVRTHILCFIVTGPEIYGFSLCSLYL